MKRNKKEEKYKELIRTKKRLADLDPHEMEWVPVEEPQFLGWEMQITLTDQGMRRADAEDLLEVLQLVGATQPRFTRYEKTVKLIKSCGGNYMKSLEAYKKSIGKKHYNWDWEYIDRMYFPYFWNYRINQTNYDKIHPRIQKYLSKYEEKATVWRDAYSYYKLSNFMSKFPFYELRIKVTRAYSTHRGIPNGEAKSENDHLWHKLEDAKFYCSKNGYKPWNYWSTWERTNDARVKRKSWSQELNLLTKTFNKEIDEEMVEDRESRAVSRATICHW